MSNDDTDLGGGVRRFETTSWSFVRRLQGRTPEDRQRALGRLAELYWKPVYCLIRHAWKRTNEDAKDLTQEFFATILLEGPLLERWLPQRGGFRAYLKAALDNFMRDQLKSAGRQKRGSGTPPLNLPLSDVDLRRLAPRAEDLPPDQLFDLAWQNQVLSRAVELLGERLAARGKGPVFEVFRLYDLRPDGEEISYETLGDRLHLKPDDVKNHLTLARREYREAVRDVVADTVSSSEDLRQELALLLGDAGE